MMQAARYTRLAMLFHWVVAVLIAINVTLVLTVDALPDTFERPMIDLHKSIGLTVLGLVIMRLIWRLSQHPGTRALVGSAPATRPGNARSRMPPISVTLSADFR